MKSSLERQNNAKKLINFAEVASNCMWQLFFCVTTTTKNEHNIYAKHTHECTQNIWNGTFHLIVECVCAPASIRAHTHCGKKKWTMLQCSESIARWLLLVSCRLFLLWLLFWLSLKLLFNCYRLAHLKRPSYLALCHSDCLLIRFNSFVSIARAKCNCMSMFTERLLVLRRSQRTIVYGRVLYDILCLITLNWFKLVQQV